MDGFPSNLCICWGWANAHPQQTQPLEVRSHFCFADDYIFSSVLSQIESFPVEVDIAPKSSLFGIIFPCKHKLQNAGNTFFCGYSLVSNKAPDQDTGDWVSTTLETEHQRTMGIMNQTQLDFLHSTIDLMGRTRNATAQAQSLVVSLLLSRWKARRQLCEEMEICVGITQPECKNALKMCNARER